MSSSSLAFVKAHCYEVVATLSTPVANKTPSGSDRELAALLMTALTALDGKFYDGDVPAIDEERRLATEAMRARVDVSGLVKGVLLIASTVD